MKIGILTFHNADNYGAVLQCYALQEYLKEKYSKDDIYVINYKNAEIEKSFKLIRKRKKIISNISQFVNFRSGMKKRKVFNLFRKKYFRYGTDELSFYDLIIYGSDQIWNSSITNNDLIFLGQKYSGKKITYGASDGGELLINSENEILLKNFDRLSVREQSLCDRLQKLNINSEVVCDPVFLLDKSQWEGFSKKTKIDNYILSYQIASSEDYYHNLKKIGDKLNKPIIEIVYIKTLRCFIHKYINTISYITPEEFIGYFSNANFIITTSFHGTAFSLLFNKSFYVLRFKNRIDRIECLLKEFNLNDRIIDHVDDISYIEYTDLLLNRISNYTHSAIQFLGDIKNV